MISDLKNKYYKTAKKIEVVIKKEEKNEFSVFFKYICKLIC